jgi:hypothetical protein
MYFVSALCIICGRGETHFQEKKEMNIFCPEKDKTDQSKIFFPKIPTSIRLSLPNIWLPNIRRAIMQPNIHPTGLSVVH